MNCVVTTYWFRSRSSKSISRTVTCSPFGPNGIDRSPVSQAANSSFALTRPSVADADHDRAELVEDVVGPVGLRRDLGVQADQRLAQVILDEDFVRLPREILWGEEVPAKARDLSVPARKPGPDSGVVRDAAAESVADEGFDGVGLVEAQRQEHS